MLTIVKGRPIEIDWFIFRGANKQAEDFSGLDGNSIKAFLIGEANKYAFPVTVQQAVDENNKQYLQISISAEASALLDTGIYDIKAMWVKNSSLHLGRQVSNQYWSMSQLSGVFAMTADSEEDNTRLDSGSTAKKVLRSFVEPTGYDGMSAWEIAVVHGYTGSESKWVLDYEEAEERMDYEMDSSKEGDGTTTREMDIEAEKLPSDYTHESWAHMIDVTWTGDESTRQTNEGTRQDNEIQRKKNEGQFGDTDPDYATSRIKKELDRQSAESTRQDQEGTRQENESSRSTAEDSRQQSEGQGAYASHASYPNTRRAKEAARQTAETARQNAESNRGSAEQSRQEYEGQGDYSDTTAYPNTRRAKEAARQTAETARDTAETARQKAEGQLGSSDPDYATSRVKQELDRQDAESARVTAETGRENRAVSSTTITYGSGSSATDPTSVASWSAEVPSVPAGEFLWSKVDYLFGDNTHKYCYSVGLLTFVDNSVTQNKLAADSGAIFDVSLYNTSGSTVPSYANLAAALAVVPSNRKAVGMSLKFINSSTGQYEQYRFLDTDLTNFATPELWAYYSNSVIVDNPEYVEVHVDSEDKILYGVKSDGDFFFGAGVPSQVQDAIDAEKARAEAAEATKANTDDMETALAGKVDKLNAAVTGNITVGADADIAGDLALGGDANITGDVTIGGDVTLGGADLQSITNPEYIEVKTDSEDHILEGIKSDGTKVIGADLNVGGNSVLNGDLQLLGSLDISGATYSLCQSPEWIKVLVDSQERIIAGVRTDGSYVWEVGFESALAYIKELTFDISSGKTSTVDTLNINTQLNLSDKAKITLKEDLGFAEVLPQPTSVKFDFSHNVNDFADELSKITILPTREMIEKVYGLFDELVALYPDYVTKYDPMASESTIQTVTIDGTGYTITVNTLPDIKNAMQEAGFSDYPIYAKGISEPVSETITCVDGFTYNVEYGVTPAYKTYMYKFACERAYINTNLNKKEKVFLLSNTHGNEVSAPLNLYLFMKQLCDGVTEDANFYKLRAAFDFYAVPHLNGYGCYHSTRCNARRVDLNRNFPIASWSIADKNTIDNDNLCSFTGPSAGSEFETQLVINLIRMINPLFAVDLHNHGGGDCQLYSGLINKNGLIITKLAQQASANMAYTFGKEFPEYFGNGYHDILFGSTADAPGYNANLNLPHTYCWWYEYGVKFPCLIEVGTKIDWRNGEREERTDTWFSPDFFSIAEYTLRIQLITYLQYTLENKAYL